jgi:adenylyltransferase/sulfurtransferase
MTPSNAEIDCRSVKHKLDAGEKFLLLDCRERDEHATVNIPQAQLIPMSEIGERVAELEPWKSGEIVVHCHHGGRSLKVTMWLRQRGFENVRSMAGGIDEWAIDIDPSLPRY